MNKKQEQWTHAGYVARLNKAKKMHAAGNLAGAVKLMEDYEAVRLRQEREAYERARPAREAAERSRREQLQRQADREQAQAKHWCQFQDAMIAANSGRIKSKIARQRPNRQWTASTLSWFGESWSSSGWCGAGRKTISAFLDTHRDALKTHGICSIGDLQKLHDAARKQGHISRGARPRRKCVNK